jgi:hypothetical protein
MRPEGRPRLSASCKLQRVREFTLCSTGSRDPWGLPLPRVPWLRVSSSRTTSTPVVRGAATRASSNWIAHHVNSTHEQPDHQQHLPLHCEWLTTQQYSSGTPQLGTISRLGYARYFFS